MEVIIALALVLLFVTIPIGLVSVSGKVYGNGATLPVVAGKLVLSFIAHFLITIFATVLIVLAAVGVDPRPGSSSDFNYSFGIASQIVCIFIILAYGFIGWLLCSFVNGDLVKSYKSLNLSEEKPRSIFQLTITAK